MNAIVKSDLNEIAFRMEHLERRLNTEASRRIISATAMSRINVINGMIQTVLSRRPSHGDVALAIGEEQVTILVEEFLTELEGFPSIVQDAVNSGAGLLDPNITYLAIADVSGTVPYLSVYDGTNMGDYSIGGNWTAGNLSVLLEISSPYQYFWLNNAASDSGPSTYELDYEIPVEMDGNATATVTLYEEMLEIVLPVSVAVSIRLRPII